MAYESQQLFTPYNATLVVATEEDPVVVSVGQDTLRYGTSAASLTSSLTAGQTAIFTETKYIRLDGDGNVLVRKFPPWAVLDAPSSGELDDLVEEIGGDVRFQNNVRIGENPSVDLFADQTSKWAGIDFAMVTDRGGGNRLHARAANLVGIDPPELVFRGLGPNNTAPFGPGQDGTGFEQANLGRGLGRIAWQGLTQRSGDDDDDQGSFQGWAAHIGCHAGENIRADTLVVTLASEVTLGAATPGTITITGDMDSVTLNDGEIGEFHDSGTVRIGGTKVTYAGRSATKLFGCEGGGVSTATITIDPTGDNNKLKYTAKSSGAAGNSTTIRYADPGAASQSLSVGVVGSAITVNLATDSLGNITTTANDIQTAIRASATAAALVNVNNKFINPLSDGSGTVPAVAATNLAGGTDGTTFAAGQNVQQVQVANGGVLHLHTSANGTNSRSHRLRIQPEGSVAIGEKAILEGITNFFIVQGGQSRFKELPAPTNLTGTTVGTAGVVTLKYRVVGNSPHAGQTSVGTVTATTAPNTLSDSNYIKLEWDSGAGPITWDVIRSEVQRVTVDATAGQFKLTFDGQQTADIAFDASAATVTTALEALSNIASGDVVVTGGPGGSGGTTPYFVTFDGVYAGTNVAEMTGANGTTPLSGGAASVVVVTTLPPGPIVYRQSYAPGPGFGGIAAAVDRGQATAALNEIQEVTVRNADSGTFRLAYGGGETNAIEWDASAATMQTRLGNIAALTGNVTVTKTQNFPPSWRIEFTGTLAGLDTIEKLRIREPLLLENEDAADEDDQEDIPDPSVDIRVRVKGGPITYTLPTRNSTADMTVDGKVTASQEVEIDGALNHDGTTVGFYGTAPITKQTGVAVTAGGIHAALVALGLIAA